MTQILRFIATLVTFAILIQGLVPQGWMPVGAHGEGQQVLLVICTENGAQEQWVTISGPGEEHPQPQDPGQTSICPYSMAGAEVAPPAFLPIALSTVSKGAEWATLPFTHESAGFHRRYDARGPPQYS